MRSLLLRISLPAIFLTIAWSPPVLPSEIVSPGTERALAFAARRDFLAEHDPLPADDPLARKVREVGATVAAVSGRPDLPFAFYVLQTDFESAADQAVSLPGGTVALTRRLADRLAETDDRLAFALAHEVAHVALRHHLFPERAGEQELEADRYGSLYLVRAGYRFQAATEALETVASARRDAVETPGHPGYPERIRRLTEFRQVLERSVRAFRSGLEALDNGGAERAVDAFGIFVQQFPHAYEGRVNLGTACLVRLNELAGSPGDLDEPLPLVRESGISIRGDENSEELDCASRNFRQALAARPAGGPAILGLALVRMREANMQEANQLLGFAESVGVDRGNLLLARGNARFLEGDYPAAAALFRQAEAERTDWISPEKNLALTLVALGETKLAESAWRRLFREPRLRNEARRQLASLAQD